MHIQRITDDAVEQWAPPTTVASASEPIEAVIDRLNEALGIKPLHTVKLIQARLTDHPLDHLIPADYSWDPRAGA